ncbi:MAG TPA: hypothetical protein VLA88_06685 [Candidatus Saccharimonadales bacterium]|nr:hypothetical protein [Candidatus Saccharimonadales bacterium]
MDENKQAPNTAPPEPTPVQTPTPSNGTAPAPAPAEPTPTPPMTQPLAPGQPVAVTPPKSRKLLPLIIVVALLVVAGIAYGVYAYVTNTPDYLLSKATEQLGRDANNAMAAKFKIVTGTNSASASFTGDIAVRGDAANKNGELVMGLGTGNSRVTLSARSVEEILYLKLGSLSNLPNLIKGFSADSAELYDSPDMKAALARIDSKWFSLTKEDLNSVGAEINTGEGQPTPQELQKLLEIYRKHKVFQADKSQADETIDGIATAHFTIKMNKTELAAFFNDVKAANLKGFKVTDTEIQEAQKAADEFNSKAAADVWVTRDSKKFKQMRFASADQSNPGSFTLTFVTDLPQFEKLEKPADARPFSELMTTFLGPMYTSPELGTDADL